MTSKKSKIIIIVTIVAIILVTSFLLYWFLGRTNDYKLIEFDVKTTNGSLNGDKLPDPNYNECGQKFEMDYLATGDFIAPTKSFEWTAYFDYSMKVGSTWEFMRCGGSIINERYILTAAHCVFALENDKVKIDKIRLGVEDENTSSNCGNDGHCINVMSVGIEQIIPHPGYDPLSRNVQNDIALIRVDQDIKYNVYVKPVCLPDRTVLSGKKYLVGWGENLSSNKLVRDKRVVAFNYETDKICKKYFVRYFKTDINNTTQICSINDNMKNFCMRDSGNSVAVFSVGQWYAEAIDSFGSRCDHKADGSMGFYLLVAPYKDWIKLTIKK